MSADFSISVGATLPKFQITVKDRNGAVDLTGASTPTFIMARNGVNEVNDASNPAITTATSGEMEHIWQSGDTDTPGIYEAWFEVTISSKKLRFGRKDGRPFIIRVTEDRI